MKLFEWDGGGSFRVAFSTRLGGVSEGPFESLNLGILTADDPTRVVENRRRLCAVAEADAETATMAWQVHGSRVAEADSRGIVTPGTVYERCDGLWTDRPGQTMVLLTADCFPVALARTSAPARLAVLHVGWRGLLAGIVEAGVAAVGGDAVTAAVGPGIGACCYEVGDEVLEAFAGIDGAASGRMLDLRAVIAAKLAAAGVTDVRHVDRCTSCEPELYFSHRRDRGVTGRQAGIIVRDGR